VFQGNKWIFAAPDPVFVGTDLATDKKRALITEITEYRNLSSSCIDIGIENSLLTILFASVRC
jgi:hypothetical protein